MSYRIKLLILICTIIIGCTNKPMNHRKVEITKVSFARESSPYLAIEIDSTMNYKYFGGEGAKKKGYFTGKLSEADWTDLKDLLERVDYSQVDTIIELKGEDIGVELVVQGLNMGRHYYGKVIKNDRFYKAYEWFINSIDRLKLKRSQDTLRFERRLENNTLTPIGPKFPPSLN